MTASKTLLTLALSSLLVFSGCGSEPEKTPASSENSGYETQKTYTLAEVAKHNTRSDCWTVVNGTVANVTSFFGKHPGGDDNLAKACGKNATVMFESVKKHDPKGYAKLKTLSVGTLAE